MVFACLVSPVEGGKGGEGGGAVELDPPDEVVVAREHAVQAGVGVAGVRKGNETLKVFWHVAGEGETYSVALRREGGAGNGAEGRVSLARFRGAEVKLVERLPFAAESLLAQVQAGARGGGEVYPDGELGVVVAVLLRSGRISGSVLAVRRKVCAATT